MAELRAERAESCGGEGGGGVDQAIVSSPHYRFGTTQPSVALVTLSLSEGTRRPECESYHSFLYIAELKNA